VNFYNVRNTATGDIYRIWAPSGGSAITMTCRLKGWDTDQCEAREDIWEEG